MIRLRSVTMGDAYPLWIWTNDPVTRAGAGGRQPVSWADHCRWLKERIDGLKAVIYLAESIDGCPMGFIQFETSDGWRHARLSYVVAPEARAAGTGEILLRLGLDQIGRTRPGTEIDALVPPDNGPSQTLFTKLGWTAEPLGDHLRFTPRGEAK